MKEIPVQRFTPAPELKKLEYFAGNWISEGDMKPSPMGPGGKMTMTEHNRWMDGGFFLTLHSEFKIADMGSGSGVAFMGYDTGKKVFTYDEFNSMGEAEHSIGTLDGDTWTWIRDMPVGGNTMKGRFTLKILSPVSYSFKFELSADGNSWSTIMDGKATKQT
jgi:hypothetical protein